MTKVIDIEGIGEIYAQKLHEAGVDSTEALLEQGATPKGRKELADRTGISERLILKWVNRADLFRVKGIGEQYSDLLAAAGVETVLELAQRRPDHLHQKMVETNEAKKLVRVVPGAEQVADWVTRAQQLPALSAIETSEADSGVSRIGWCGNPLTPIAEG
jgi:predicted flap endonuclease-1-like 5' DNA nuclease